MKTVRCINADGTGGMLTDGKVYEVENTIPDTLTMGLFFYTLKGMGGVYTSNRFVDVSTPQRKRVRCIDCGPYGSSAHIHLKKGQVYEVESEICNANHIFYKLVGVISEWIGTRFEVIKEKQMVRCIYDNNGRIGINKGNLYELVGENTTYWTIMLAGNQIRFAKMCFEHVNETSALPKLPTKNDSIDHEEELLRCKWIASLVRPGECICGTNRCIYHHPHLFQSAVK